MVTSCKDPTTIEKNKEKEKKKKNAILELQMNSDTSLCHQIAWRKNLSTLFKECKEEQKPLIGGLIHFKNY